ncbi:alpha/beta fold hydrolase, partial [Bacteroidota bacterium]
MKKRIVITLITLCCLFVNNLFGQYEKVNSDGLDIYYRIFGEGKPVLIIGGGPGDSSDRYLSLCDVVSKDFQCILVEQRGCGKSAPEIYDSTTISINLTLKDFEILRNHLDIEQWTALGFSYGGYLASLYAHFYPSSLSSLILMGSMGLNTNVFGHFLDNINSRLQAADLKKFEYWNDSVRIAQDPHHALVERIRTRMPGYFYDRKKSLIVSQEMKDEHFNFNVGKFIWPDVINRNLDLAEMDCPFYGPVLIL